MVGLHDMKAVRTTVRSCLACKQPKEKAQMLRLVVDDSGLIWPDLLQKAPGRGTYLCMEDRCWHGLNDKRLGALRSKFAVVLPQWDALQVRLEDALRKMICVELTRLKSSAAVGRDAVMHQMWKGAPILLMMVNEAGQALVRQVMDAVVKRDELGLKTIPLKDISDAWLLEVFQRGKVAVVALPVSRQTEKLQKFCTWHGHLKGSKVSDGE